MPPVKEKSSTPQRYNAYIETEDEARLLWDVFSLARYGEVKPFPDDATARPTRAHRGGSLFDRLHQVDLAAYAGRFTELAPVGPGKWRGRCPLHDERTPSLYVYHDEAKGWRWRCFGACVTGGDIVDLARELKLGGKVMAVAHGAR